MTDHQRGIESNLGRPVTLEVQPQGIDPANLASLFFTPLVRALLDVCRDDQGRAHLAKRLERIVIRNSGTVVSSRTWCTFEDGVLTLGHTATDLDDIEEPAQRLVRVLEQGLS